MDQVLFESGAPITLSIKAIQAVNCKGSKASLNSFVRIQFADFDYKDTATISDSLNPEYNTTFDQTFNVDETLIEVFANKTVSFIVHESLPKDKTAILGSGELSLFKPFLNYFKRGDFESTVPECPLSFTQTIPISYLNPKLLTPNQDPPALNVEITLSRPLLTPGVLAASNFITVMLEDIRPVPEEWSLREGTEKDSHSNIYSYTANFTIPSNSDEPRNIIVPNGVLCLTDSKPDLDPISSAPQAILLPENTKQSGDSVPSSNDDPTVGGEKDAKVVKWTQSQIIWMSPNAMNKFREQHVKKIEIDLIRVLQPKFAAVHDPNASKYKAKTFVDVSVALNPSVIGIKGRFNLEATETDQSKKGSDVYKSIGSNIGLKLLFSSPFMTKKRMHKVTKTVQDYIQKRVVSADILFQKRSAQASSEYQGKILEIVHQLVEEFRQSLQLEANLKPDSTVSLSTQSPQEEDNRKKLFLYHLNKSGAYFNMKEQLKVSVVQIVRERFKKKSPFTGKGEMQLFMSEAYVYLIDEMHNVLNGIYDSDETEGKKTHATQIELNALKEFADEAEWNRQISIAAKYHQQRIAKFDENLNAWFDYSAFCMRNGLKSMGQEGIKEILSRNPKHIPSLLTHGMICVSGEKMEEARTFLDKALELDPDNVVGLSVMSIMFEFLGEEGDSEKYFALAKAQSSIKNKGAPRNFLEVAQFAINVNCGDIADKALAQDIVLNGPSSDPYILISALEVQRNRQTNPLEPLYQALAINKADRLLWAAIGHLHYVQKKYTEAKIAFENCLSMKTSEKARLDLVYLRLGHINLKLAYNSLEVPDTSISSIASRQIQKADDGFARIAKGFYLNACAIHGTSQTWLGVGRACFALKEYTEAEDAFSEANIINNRDSDVWAHLSLLCLTVGRLVEANQAIAQALRLRINDTEVLKLVGIAFLEAKQKHAAVELFRLAVEGEPDNAAIRSLLTKALAI